MELLVEGSPHVTVDAAARELQTTHLRVLMLLKHRVLTGCLVDGEWHVEQSSLDALKRDTIPRPEPPTCKTSCTAVSCGCVGGRP